MNQLNKLYNHKNIFYKIFHLKKKIGDNVVIIWAVDALKYHKQIVIDALLKN